MELNQIYKKLYDFYGSQGWWPVIIENRQGLTDDNGYHKNNPVLTVSSIDKYEITAGAVLTQNTNWKNVSASLTELKKNKIYTADYFIEADETLIKSIIKKTGYYNQKYLKLKMLFEYMKSLNVFEHPENLTREALLSRYGIGEETADSILLYAFNRPVFVIDAYTKRFLYRLNNIKYKTYKEYSDLFMNNIKCDIEIYNEYHALIVRHSVDICRKKPLCSSCFLEPECINRE